MLVSVLPLLFVSILHVHNAQSLRVPLQLRTITRRGSSHPNLYPRANTSVSVQSDFNTQYLSNITIGGAQYTVTIDTGSSDLWITGTAPRMQDLGKSTSVTYAVGQVSGEINAAVVEFSGYTVPDQALMFIQNAASTGFNTTEVTGLIGLGPSSSSNIRVALGTSSGDPFLDRVYRQNISTPNFITVLLGREGDPGNSIQGELTIGEVISEFSNITNQPQVSVHPTPLKTAQHWSGYIDGILGPDGENITLDAISFGTPKGQLLSIFDTGYTLPQVPRAVSDAIYGRVQGATYDTANGWWRIPCDQEVNLTVVVSGQNYPIHPLDTSSSGVDTTVLNGVEMCVGAFQPISTALDGTFDAIMGMAFLRNTYTLINSGDFVDGNPSNQGAPYMQLLSVTDPGKAHMDFVKTRLNGTDTTGDSAHAILPASQGQRSPESVGERAKTTFYRYWPYLVAGAGLLVVTAMVVLVWRCCCGARRRPIKGGYIVGPYRPLNEPAPGAAMDLHAMPPHGAYSDPYYRG